MTCSCFGQIVGIWRQIKQRRQMLTVFSLATALGMAALPFAPAIAGDNLIIPGQSIGQTHLGSNGYLYLSKLPKSDAVDVGMSQSRQVWVAKKEGKRFDTLFIHTVSNGARNVQPIDGITIDNLRVTSPWFHTHDGISTRSTLAQIRHRFPNVRPVYVNQTLYDDAKLGIAFEFAQSATAEAPCIAIMVHPPGDTHVANKEEVNQLLRSGDRP